LREQKYAIQHFYRYSLLKDKSLERLAGFIRDDPSIGSHIRSLFTVNQCGPPDHFRTILAHATGLVRLSGPPNPVFLPGSHPSRQTPVLDFSGLEALGSAAGSTLETLTGQVIIRPNAPKSPTPLYAFTALRTLDWETPAKLKFKPEEVPPDALPNLESLSCTSVNDTFLSLLQCMRLVSVTHNATPAIDLTIRAPSLPALRHVAFPNALKMVGAHEFLQKHGAKLVTLKTDNGRETFALCPAISVLYLSGVRGYLFSRLPFRDVQYIFSRLHVSITTWQALRRSF
jgi:hypothetical protein